MNAGPRKQSSPAVPPVCALVGDDELGQRETVRQLAASFLGAGEGDQVGLDGAAHDAHELCLRVFEELKTRPLGGGRKLVVVRQAEELVQKEKGPLVDYLKAPASFSCLVLVARSFGKGHNALRNALKKAGAYREFTRPADTVAPWKRDRQAEADTDLNRWVEARARRRKLRLAPGVAAALTARVGSNLGELESILARWEWMHGPAAEVPLDAVAALGPRHRAATGFALVDAVLARDARRALEVLGCCFSEGMVMGDRKVGQAGDMLAPVMALALRRFRLAARAQRLVAQRVARGDLARALGLAPFLLGQTLEEARRFDEAELRFAIRRLLEADRAFKFRGMRAEDVLVDLVLDLVRGRPAPAPVGL